MFVFGVFGPITPIFDFWDGRCGCRGHFWDLRVHFLTFAPVAVSVWALMNLRDQLFHFRDGRRGCGGLFWRTKVKIQVSASGLVVDCRTSTLGVEPRCRLSNFDVDCRISIFVVELPFQASRLVVVCRSSISGVESHCRLSNFDFQGRTTITFSVKSLVQLILKLASFNHTSLGLSLIFLCNKWPWRTDNILSIFWLYPTCFNMPWSILMDWYFESKIATFSSSYRVNFLLLNIDLGHDFLHRRQVRLYCTILANTSKYLCSLFKRRWNLGRLISHSYVDTLYWNV